MDDTDTRANFWASPTLAEIIEQQGKKPVLDIAALQGDFWPEEESVEEFLAFLNDSRGRGKPNTGK